MSKNSGSFLERLNQQQFDRRINHEIFERIMPHTMREKNFGYPFHTDKEMDAETKKINAQDLLYNIEILVSAMPKAYSKAFRHVMHRELQKQLLMYMQVAQRRVKRTCDPKWVARPA